jgi:hypothetical protein
MGLSGTPGNEKFRHEALQSLDPIGFTFKVLLDLPFLSSKGPVQIVWALEIGCVQMRVVILHLGEPRSLVYEKPPFQANAWRHRYEYFLFPESEKPFLSLHWCYKPDGSFYEIHRYSFR